MCFVSKFGAAWTRRGSEELRSTMDSIEQIKDARLVSLLSQQKVKLKLMAGFHWSIWKHRHKHQ